VIAWRGVREAGATRAMLAEPVKMAEYAKGGPAHWAGSVTTRGTKEVSA